MSKKQTLSYFTSYYEKNKEHIKRKWSKRYKENHAEVRAIIHRAYLKRKYGITPEEYQSMGEKQGWVCAICGKPETRKWRGKVTKLSVDHNHKTGKVRKLLCNSCNSLIKGESIELLENAIKYLRED